MAKKFFCALALLLVLVSSAFAADWPTKTINIYVTHAAGGDTDYMARQLGAQLEKILGVSVVLSNVTGSNGATCMQQYRNGATDGYTFIATNTAALNGNEATGMVDFGYNAFEPVAVYGIQSGENIVVKASSPYKTLQDLIDASKAKPGTIRLGISMGGGVYIMACVLMNIGKAQFNIIEAGDAANRLTALLGDAIDATSIPYSSAADYIEKGELRSLCTVLSKSPTLLPGQPAASDVIPQLKLDTEYALLAPKGTPAEIVKAMNAAVMKACATPEWKKIVNDFSWQDPFYFDVEGSIANLKAQRDLFMSLVPILEIE
ncbi:MAG: tripartite tricarboxylate transporter substrate binding protein [Synergistaceae bacterium]|nr:tripartite tricarboxylate transporter substrate binding protein [Synergistaceae bacterium]